MLSKVITIAQQKGGTGKTTLAVHLALAFVKYHNLKVVIIDTDPQGSLGKWFMVRSKKNSLNKNLTFKKDNDIVIIDTPPKIESDARPSIEAADLVLIPMTPSHVDFWATEAIIDIAKKAEKKVLIQINRANQRSKLINKTHEYIKSINVAATDIIIGNRQIYPSSMGEGKTAVEKQKQSKAVEEIKKLSEQILSEIK